MISVALALEWCTKEKLIYSQSQFSRENFFNFALRVHALTNEFLHLPAGFSLENVFHVDESAFNFQ